MRKYTADEKGLKNAIEYMRSFYTKNDRLPKSTDKEMRAIKSGIHRKRWTQFGIKTWSDLMIKTFNKINVRRKIYTKNKEGLIKAVTKLQEFYNKHNEYPKSTDEGMGKIVTAIQRGNWKQFGVIRWQDLFKLTFNKEIQRSPLDGEEGLKTAKQELQKFRRKHNRMPKYSDKEMNPIRHAATSGKWVDFGIKKWNDLLRLTFGEVSHEPGIYKGENGLKRAKEKILKFFHEEGRKPTTKDEGMKGVIGAIRRKYWQSTGIHSWNDLIEETLDISKKKVGTNKIPSPE